MIDIHAHILPGLDDGAQDMETSLQMARNAAADGIKQIIATPHVISTGFPNSREKIMEAVFSLRQALQQENIPLELFPGGEYRLEADLPQRIQQGQVLTLNDSSRYILIELPSSVLPPFFERVMYDIQLQGLTPIIAHPERNQVIMEKPQLLQRLTERGILAQITATSVTGDFGRGIKKSAWQIIKQGSAHFIASDAHHHRGRRSPKLSAAWAEVKKQTGEQAARRLINENPARVVAGLELEKQSTFEPRSSWHQKLTFFSRNSH